MIEHSHLKIMQALHIHGTLTEAANALCLSQSALSHQIKFLEKKLEVSLWQREGRNLRLTQAGELLLQVALQVLPVFTQAEKTLKAYGEGHLGTLRIGVECYPCYEWLTGVIGSFLQQLPNIDIDIINKFQFSGLEGLLNHHIDILLTPDLIKKDALHYVTLASYQLVLLVATDHALATHEIIQPEQLSDETLFTFPVSHERLDIYLNFLNPALVKPHKHKTIESLDIMLELTLLKRGVCVIPEWLADKKCQYLDLKKIRLGKTGIQQKLFLAMRKSDKTITYIDDFITVAQQTAYNSFR